MCLYPKLIQNPKYKSNKKNRGVIPPINDKRVLAVPVKCGNCMECRRQKKNEWLTRLSIQLEDNQNKKLNTIMTTLTFSTESLKKLKKEILKEQNVKGYELDNAIATLAIRRFTENYRSKYKETLKHWCITELGKGRWEHLHIHALLWCKDISGEKIREKWIYGMTWSNDEVKNGYTNQKTLNYYVKYVNKVDEKHPNYKPKILASKGIGKQYVKEGRTINKYNKDKTNEYIRLQDGRKTNMPIYFRNNIYTDEEREKLWLTKLDKDIRYVNGIKTIDDENYYKVREVARKDNQKLGYGKREKHSKIQDENYKREQLIIKRLGRNGAIRNGASHRDNKP